jgi:hypothetical protein
MDDTEFKIKVVERLTKIESHLDRNTASLDEHIRRTNQLEDRVEHIENHVTEVGGAIKLVRGLAWGVSVLVSALALLKAIGYI